METLNSYYKRLNARHEMRAQRLLKAGFEFIREENKWKLKGLQELYRKKSEICNAVAYHMESRAFNHRLAESLKYKV